MKTLILHFQLVGINRFNYYLHNENTYLTYFCDFILLH